MKWVKKGLIFKANGEYGWIKSFAQVPKVLVLEDRLRVYFGVRPEASLSCIAMMDLDIDNPCKIIRLYEKPVLVHGNAGDYDEHGVMPNGLIRDENKVYLSLGGWSRRMTVPYSNWIGLAVSEDNGLTFTRCTRGPVLDRTPDEIWSATGLVAVKDNDIWNGIYVNGTAWYLYEGKYEQAYELVCASSKDLIHWENRTGIPILPRTYEREANCNPTLLKVNDMYHLWFCYRGVQDYRGGNQSYRIGYACSKDFKHWTRDDARAGIDISVNGWDSEMIEYPEVVKVKDKYLMFYNGNGFGQSGFGYAELEGEL